MIVIGLRALGKAGGCAHNAAAKINTLRGGHEFDSNDLFDIRRHLTEFESGGAAHADVIFDVSGSRDGVDASGVGEDFVLSGESGGSVLENHEAGVETTIDCQESRECLGVGGFVGETHDAALGDIAEAAKSDG